MGVKAIEVGPHYPRGPAEMDAPHPPAPKARSARAPCRSVAPDLSGHRLDHGRALGRGGTTSAEHRRSPTVPTMSSGTAPGLTIVGSVNLDLVARCRELPRPGETITASAFSLVAGGKGANQALAAQRMGARVTMVARVGRDSYGELALAELRAGGVDLAAVRPCDEPTGIAMILVDDRGENQIVVVPGANAALTAADVQVPTGDAVLVQLEVGDGPLVEAARQCRALFAVNAAPSRPVAAEVLTRADLVIVNRLEAEALGPLRPDTLVAVTYGADGASLHRGAATGPELARATPPPVVAVDGTAAGDAFCGGLVVALLQGRPHDEALRRGCAAGALAASKPGAQPSLPTASAVDAILAP